MLNEYRLIQADRQRAVVRPAQTVIRADLRVLAKLPISRHIRQTNASSIVSPVSALQCSVGPSSSRKKPLGSRTKALRPPFGLRAGSAPSEMIGIPFTFIAASSLSTFRTPIEKAGVPGSRSDLKCDGFLPPPYSMNSNDRSVPGNPPVDICHRIRVRFSRLCT